MCHSVENEKRMRLFVVGEVFSDPENWSRLSQRTLILAETKEQALDMIDTLTITEVRMDKPAIL
jgi:hypothetical protein